MTVIVTLELLAQTQRARCAACGLSTAFVCSISKQPGHQYSPLSERTAKFAGGHDFARRLPALYTIYIKTHFAFVIGWRTARSAILYIPTSANTQGPAKAFLRSALQQLEENGPGPDRSLPGATCPTGLTRIESSVGAGYGQAI
jgi:hypothetical protein